MHHHRIFAIGLLLSLFISISWKDLTNAEENTDALPFSDVSETNRYRDAIAYLYEEGVVKGYADGTFQPYKEISRGEALKIILLSLDKMDQSVETETETVATTTFQDISADAWYAPYIEVGTQKGIVSGYPDGFFYPEKMINRAEALKMMLLAAGAFREPYATPTLTEAPALDVPLESWYMKYAYYALTNALTYVDAEGNLHAEEAITRGELADLIYRLHHPGVYSGQIEYGKATYYGWSWEGVNTASGETMSQHDYLAAHKTLPFGTYVRVTNLDTGATVTVKIVDRGPYGEGRIIDLTASAFEAIGSLSTGILDVEIEVVYVEEVT